MRIFTFHLGLYCKENSTSSMRFIYFSSSGVRQWAGVRTWARWGLCKVEATAPWLRQTVSHGREGRPSVVRSGIFKIKSCKRGSLCEISQLLYIATNWYMYIQPRGPKQTHMRAGSSTQDSGVWPLWPQSWFLTRKQLKGNKIRHILQGINYTIA